MRDRTTSSPSAPPSARGLAGTVLITGALLYFTRDVTVPFCVLYAVILIAAWLIVRAHFDRADALREAGIQQRRASILDGARHSPAIEALHAGPRDQLIGHDDRDAVIDRLRDRYASGHLMADDFETRTTEAGRARTRGQLARVLRDLP